MRSFAWAAAFAAIVLASSICEAAVVGNWIVTIEKDPFSSKKKSVALLPDLSGNKAGLAVRCFPEGGLSAVIIMVGGDDKHFDAGTKVPYKYRADEGDIVEDQGEAFGKGLIELPNARQILVDAAKAKRIYVRVTDPDAATIDLTFAPRFSVRALAQINADCAESKTDDKSPDDSKSKY